ncbi:MAG: DUF5127 domain-containing protein, partial [Syntrophothermus sp.]
MSKQNFLSIPGSIICLFVLLLLTNQFKAQGTAPQFRPPSTPLITSDPYFSIWSPSDHPGDESTRHWTGHRNAVVSMARIDGITYRLVGNEPRHIKTMPMTAKKVTPTQTIFNFSDAKVKITLTFTSPLLPHDLLIFSLPVTYITWKAEAADGQTHKVEVYFDCSPEIAVNSNEQQVSWSRNKLDNMEVLSAGSKDQNILPRSGDDLRIEWGHLYLVSPDRKRTESSLQGAWYTWDSFIKS